MKLKFNNNYISVKKFEEIEISDFSFFTGINGSGKTHILEAIKNNNISVDNINPAKILLFNYGDFAINFQTKTDAASKTNAWNTLSGSDPNNPTNQFKVPENILVAHRDMIERIAQKLDKPIFRLTEDDLKSEPNNEEALTLLNKYKRDIGILATQESIKSDDNAQSVYESVIWKSTKFLSSIEEDEFMLLFQKTAFGGRTIISDLSSIFLEYHKNLLRNELLVTRKKKKLSKEEFINKFGPSPWELIRTIFLDLELNFDINDPVTEDIDFDGPFLIKFINKSRDNKEIPFDHLSSGEKILITLVNAIYSSRRRNNLPELILLDEIDGPLNPSIIKNFIDYIKENFVNEGIKIIIATHSPSTVAFAPEGSVYKINTNSALPMMSVSNGEATELLSEGYITLTDLLKFNQIKSSKILVSEGRNYEYLEIARKYYGKDIDLAILNIKFLGFGQLRNLFDFIRCFNSSKEFIFVWDCDYRIEKKNNADLLRNLDNIKNACNKKNRTYIFSKNSNGLVSSGIENLFNSEIGNDYKGSLELDRIANKDHFTNHILSRKNEDDFKNFKELFDFISSDQLTNL